MTRNEIAKELMIGCPEELENSHSEIADAIRNGEPVNTVLKMCEDYIDTYLWVRRKLKELEN